MSLFETGDEININVIIQMWRSSSNEAYFFLMTEVKLFAWHEDEIKIYMII